MADVVAAWANAALDAAMALLNGGTLEYQTAGSVEVATCTLNATAQSGSAAAGSATFGAITKDDAATGGGPITKAILKTSGGTATLRATAGEAGSLGGSDPEIVIDNDSPAAGVDVFTTGLTASYAVVTL